MKKTKTLKSKNVTQKTQKSEQKKNRVYGIIGMVALFFVGVIFGYIINGSNHINRSVMSESECKNLAENIQYLMRTNNFDELRFANEIYSENCLNRDFKEQESKPMAEDNNLQNTTCAKIESLLMQQLQPGDDMWAENHIHNAKIYANLSENGCPENSKMYKELMAGELEIARVLGKEEQKIPDTTCGKIEKILTNRLYSVDSSDANAHIDNAKIYANLSERGCPENSEMYRDLAAGELEIARAINDDNLDDKYHSVEIVETYKRLQMQAEAERMLEKAKRLTNPAIDFIIQLEKIIEE
jgi:hypothetical protein